MGGSGRSSAGDQGKGANPKDYKPHHALLGFRETGGGGKFPSAREAHCMLGRMGRFLRNTVVLWDL